MQNITELVSRSISKINLPDIGVIDIIEIALISFFIYQFMVWIKFTRAYTLLKGILVVLVFLLLAYIFKMNTILWIVSNLASALITGVIVIFSRSFEKSWSRSAKRRSCPRSFPSIQERMCRSALPTGP